MVSIFSFEMRSPERSIQGNGKGPERQVLDKNRCVFEGMELNVRL